MLEANQLPTRVKNKSPLAISYQTVVYFLFQIIFLLLFLVKVLDTSHSRQDFKCNAVQCNFHDIPELLLAIMKGIHKFIFIFQLSLPYYFGQKVPLGTALSKICKNMPLVPIPLFQDADDKIKTSLVIPKLTVKQFNNISLV